MALLDDILRWTESSLKPWQRDAARRLFQQKNILSSQDYDELYTLLKAANGLPNPKGLNPNPLKPIHLPTISKKGVKIVIKSIRDLNNVNKIAPSQKLDFSPSGMTIIYGGNASGKSGYARVMKRACRARDQDEQIYPNAYDPSSRKLVPEAVFDIEKNGIAKSIKWTCADDPPDDLATIAVFDSRCARVYLTDEQDVAFLPYGLEVVEDLANRVMPELNRRLDTEISCIDTNTQPFTHLLGETAVGQLIATINFRTDPEKLKVLGTLSDQEEGRIIELNQILTETDPRTRAKELRLSASRIKALAERIESALKQINEDAIQRMKEIDEKVIMASQAEQQAAEMLQADDTLLPGTGGEIWKALFDAARKFSTEVAYPENEFPFIEEGAVCLLCQQPLKDAGKRLLKFEEYIKNDVAKTASEERLKANTARSKIEEANLNIGFDKSLSEELLLLDQELPNIVSVFQEKIESRRSWILEAFDSHEWDDVSELGGNPRKKLRDLSAWLLRKARTYNRAADVNKSKALKVEYDELNARQNLSLCLDSVIELIYRMKKKRLLESCKNDLKTKSISDKSKEFASKVVTAELKTTLDKEFEALGIGHIKTKLRDRSEKGKIKYQLLLDLPTSFKLDKILSEGEQRAIALGSFLAELELEQHSSAIVFDDPVSSLDHLWRQKVARRLVEESSRRQVVILTHDSTFLGQLRDELELNKIDHLIEHLEWVNDMPGNVNVGLPWIHQNYKEKIDQLEKAQRALVRIPWPAYPNENQRCEMRQQYDLLRATIERVIQDVAFNGVIRRFRDWVRVDKFNSVASLSERNCNEITQLHRKCNKVVSSHDRPSDKNESVPTAQELGEDIESLKSIIKQIHESRKAK